jgi:hypothetical protein
MTKKNKTTAKHFRIFKREAELWIDRLGLKDWDVTFVHGDNPTGKPCYAWFSGEVEGRFCQIGLTPDWTPTKITVGHLKKSAFHEVFEVVLCQLSWIAECRFAREEEIPEAIHVVIRRLENLFYGKERSGGRKEIRK